MSERKERRWRDLVTSGLKPYPRASPTGVQDTNTRLLYCIQPGYARARTQSIRRVRDERLKRRPWRHRAGGKSIRGLVSRRRRRGRGRAGRTGYAAFAGVRCSNDVSRSDGPLSGWTQRGDRRARSDGGGGGGGGIVSAEEKGMTRTIQSYSFRTLSIRAYNI